MLTWAWAWAGQGAWFHGASLEPHEQRENLHGNTQTHTITYKGHLGQNSIHTKQYNYFGRIS